MELELRVPSCAEEDSKYIMKDRFVYSEVQKLSDKWVDKYGQVETGTTAYTGPGKISQIKLIIHAVGPVWSSKVSIILTYYISLESQEDCSPP